METSPSDIRYRRKLFLRIVKRRARPGTGSARAWLEKRMANKTWPDFTSLFRDIPWCVVDGVATRAYMPERATQDLDILILPEHAPTAYAALQRAGFQPLHALTIGGSSWQSPGGTLVEIIVSKAPWAAEALENLQSDPQGLPVLTLPYLVLMKFQAGRTQDLADAARMLGLASSETRQATRDLFRRWEPEGLEDLESLITLGNLEMGAER